MASSDVQGTQHLPGGSASRGRAPLSPSGAGGTTRLKRLNEPVPVREVETNPEGVPVAIELRGRSWVVVEVAEQWRIDEGWWRATPVSRHYYRLVLEDGRIVTVFRDLGAAPDDSWWTHRP